jgi:heme-degrading monooxygenase HmoA
MFARITRADMPPDRLDDFVAHVRAAAQSMAQLEGYRGVVALANRSTGAGMAGTYWDFAEAMQASEDIGRAARDSVASAIEGFHTTGPDRFEFVIQERAAPPRAGTFARMNDRQVAPASLDAVIEFMRQQVVPAIKSLSGFQTAVMLVNRDSGRMLAASVWATEAEREASAATVSPLRDQVEQLAANDQPTSVDLFEVLVADVKLAAPV